MKTAEERAEKYANKKYQDSNEWVACYFGYMAGYSEAMRCIDQKEELPEEAGCDFCRDEQGYTIGNMYVCDKCGRQVP